MPKVDQAARVRGLPDSSDWMMPSPGPCPILPAVMLAAAGKGIEKKKSSGFRVLSGKSQVEFQLDVFFPLVKL